ncbi:MAG: PKD domain-containing protein [Chitinophagales bacterium]
MKIFKILLTALFALFSTSIYAQDETFAGNPCGSGANSSTWDVPCGVTEITVEVYGAGGGGGGGGGGSNGGFFNTRGGGGGGGGGYTTITINVTPGSTFNYSVGAGGCGGDGNDDGFSGDNGNTGGNSTFSGTDAGGNAISLQANGGVRGTGGSGTGGSTGSGGSGGTASGGTTNTTGGSGNNGSGGDGGAGGAGAGPDGGAGGPNTTDDGSVYGGGGAGGGANSDGGNGAEGVIFITFVTSGATTPTPTVSTTPATCTDDGEATIDNYDASFTYTFTPAGPTVGAGGVISGMTPGTTYTVIATDAGCDSQPSTDFSIDPQTSGPNAPTVTTDPATCFSDGTATITNYDANFTYTFTPAGPSVGVGGEISGLTPGTSYTVIATDNGCDSPASNSFSVDPATSGTSIVFNPDPGPYCIDDSNPVALNATPTGGTYSGPGVSGTDFIPSNANIGTNTITYTYDDGSGCVDDESVDIEVVDLPTVSFSGLNGPYCADDASAVALTGQPAGGTFSGPGISGTDFIPEDAGTGNHTISYEFTDGNGCSNTEDNTVEVVDLPNVSAGNDAFICDGEDAQLNATGADTYVWSPTTGLSDPNVADPTVNIASEETYVVTGTDANGCVNTDTVTVGVGTNPTAEFEAASACAGTPITFTNNSSPAGLDYNWDFGNGNTSNAENPSETYSSGGDFDVQLIVDNEGCRDTAVQTLTVLEQPTAEFTASPLRAIANEDQVLFNNTSSNGSTWTWDFGDGSNLNDSFEPSHIYTEPGLYSPTLIASSADGCTDTLTIEEYIEVIEPSNFFVPNAFSPNGDGVNDVFEVFGEGIREYYIRIHDRWGELVFASDDITETWDGTNKGNILPPDVYVYYIKVSFEDLTQKTYKGSLHLLK